MQLQKSARYASWVCIAAIIGLSLVPGNERPHTGLAGKVEHFIAYAGTGIVGSIGYATLRCRGLFWAAVVTLSFVLELLQQYVPGRGPDPLDAVASSAGLTAGILVGAAGMAAIIARRYK